MPYFYKTLSFHSEYRVTDTPNEPLCKYSPSDKNNTPDFINRSGVSDITQTHNLFSVSLLVVYAAFSFL